MTNQNNGFMTLLSKKSIFFVFSFVLLGATGFSQDLFDYANSQKFARYLFSTQQYGLAAHEYERILSINPADTLAFTDLVKTYRLGNSCENGFKRLGVFPLDGFLKDQEAAKEFLNLSLTCGCCFNRSDFNTALASVSPGNRIFYTLGDYITSGKKDSSILFARSHRDFLSKSYPSLLTGIDKMEGFKPKKPGLALAMSAIVPGSGKAYSKYWGDALMSLLFVSTNAWLSYRGFDKRGVKSANGWIFGSLSVGFYLGNIFGSYKAAKTYNQIEYEKIYNEAKGAVYSGF